jgi:hypothetical protein
VFNKDLKVKEKRPLTPSPGSGEQSLTKVLDGESSQNTTINPHMAANSAGSNERKRLNDDSEKIARMI